MQERQRRAYRRAKQQVFGQFFQRARAHQPNLKAQERHAQSVNQEQSHARIINQHRPEWAVYFVYFPNLATNCFKSSSVDTSIVNTWLMLDGSSDSGLSTTK